VGWGLLIDTQQRLNVGRRNQEAKQVDKGIIRANTINECIIKVNDWVRHSKILVYKLAMERSKRKLGGGRFIYNPKKVYGL
jgi:hypothetical protein